MTHETRVSLGSGAELAIRPPASAGSAELGLTEAIARHDEAAVAIEEAMAAKEALGRTTEEAQTLKLLRDTLEEVRTETSRTYVGPVTTRAKRHIGRLLPGSELLFADDLGLTAIAKDRMRIASASHEARKNSLPF